MGAYGGVLSGLAVLIIFYLIVLQTPEQKKAELDELRIIEQEALSQLRGAAAMSSGKAHAGIPGLVRNDLSCAEAKLKVARKEWSDPNLGRIYARETETYPHFRISLHEKEYDVVRWRIMEEGKYYEDEVHQRFVDILDHQPSSYVLDVGANIGYYTLLSASLGHNVIAFEPNPSNVLRLCDSLRLNDWSNGVPDIHIFQNAVADVHGEEMMLHAPKNPGMAYLKPLEGQDEETNDHTARTTLISLDKLAEEQGWFQRTDFKIKLFKIDVEGKEPQVVLGAPKLLKSGIIEHVLTEGRRFGRTNVQDSFAVLFEAGYTIKEPAVPVKGNTPKDKAKSVCDWWLDKLGPNSQMVRDMWWVRADTM